MENATWCVIQNAQVKSAGTSVIRTCPVVPYDNNLFIRLEISYGATETFAAILFTPFPVKQGPHVWQKLIEHEADGKLTNLGRVQHGNQ
jgi:hypothetical protein